MVQADSETSLARMGDGLLDTGRPLALRYGTVSGGAKRYLMYQCNMQPYDVQARRFVHVHSRYEDNDIRPKCLTRHHNRRFPA